MILDDTAETQELFGGTTPAQVNPSSANGSAATVANHHQDVPTAEANTTMLGTMEADAVEDLYEKVLMEIVHGNINHSDVSEKALFSYAQDVFNMNEKAHEEILKKARVKPASEVHLRVELVEAKLTERATVTGALNAFVIMYLQTGLPDVVRSTIQENTNNPKWKECFTLPTSENSNENLILEVFHHDCNMTKVTKTVRVCQKYALSCVKPRSSYQKLIGRTSIPVESISSSGLVMWYSLNKTKRTDPQGTIKLKFHFSSAQNKEQAIEQHEMLTKLFLEYELNSSSVARYWWSGKFTAAGEAILNQHAICADLTATEKVLIYWNAYTTIHVTYRVAFGLFQGMLEKICPLVRSNSISPGDLNKFWNGVQLLLPSCLAVIMKLRKRIAGDNDIVKTVTSVLHILDKVDSIRETSNIPLFPPEKFEHFKHKLEQNPNISIHDVVLLAVRTGAKKWFDEAVSNTMKATFSDEEKLTGSINLIQLLQSDIIRATSYYNSPFKSILDIEYTRELCKQHEASVVAHLKPIVEKMCKGFKKLTIRLDQHNRVGEMEQLDMSTTLFELYIVLRLFIMETDKELSLAHNPDIINYHVWFSKGISHWSDVFAMKALARLSQAIDCDTLEVVPGSRQSVSAAEFLSIVRQMRAFWEELAWPDPQELNRFLKRSIGDICSCCVYYADRISTKLRPPLDTKSVDASSSLEMVQKCNLVNSNLSILIEVLTSLPDDVGYCQVDINANNEQQQLEQTLPINGLSSWKTKTLKLLVDRCMAFLKVKMEDSLNNFERVKGETENFTNKTSTMIKRDLQDSDLRLVEDELWKGITTEISAIIKRSIDKKASISSFGNLKDFYAIIAQAYLPELQDLQDDKILSERLFTIEKQLYLYSSSTRDLIHQYYLACLHAQNRLDEPDRGVLTVRCAFRNDTLEIQMIGAEDIKLPLDFKGSCDSYVKLNLVPGYKFSSVTMPKTRTKSKNHSPTYNEKFALKLSEEQRNIPDALLAFNVKVSEMLGLSQRHVGECFIRLDSIPTMESDRDINSIDIQQLFLTMPENIESDCIPVLEYRQNDKEAVQFFKKLKQKLGKAAYTGSVISIF
ncbi:hypothetical protein quinque_013760 [Culex quinquefasciatus]